VPNVVNYSYDPAGNMLSKSDVGAYTYGGLAGPHAVTKVVSSSGSANVIAYDTSGNMISSLGRQLQWFSFNKLKQAVINGGAIIDHEAPRERRFVAVEK
jgi:hypothetical protein